MKTGWIGLGAMGRPMAGHLYRSSHLDIVWNRSADKAQAFAAEHAGVRVAESLAELGAAVELICICVSADEDLHEVIAGLAAAVHSGQIIVDHSTVAPSTARKIAGELAGREVIFIDAPVSGGVEGAVNGQLAVMAGGNANAIERLRPVLAAYTRILHHLGPSGAGQSAKAVNQLMVAGIAEAVCESLALMKRLDLPTEPMLELLGGGAAGNWFLDKRGQTMLDDSFVSGFAPELLLKDLRICEQLCEETGFDSAVLRQALSDYQAVVDAGEAGRDISALFRYK